MKFLCIACDEPMKLRKTKGPDASGSLSMGFYCPKCFQEFAMLTNSFETQMVTSMGVKIGGQSQEKTGGDASKCPFPGMVQKSMGGSDVEAEGQFPWTAIATERLKNIPEFVRPMAKKGIEKFAREKGYAQVDELVLDQAKVEFGM